TNKNLLREFYCDNNKPMSISPFYECPSGTMCQNGACKTVSQQSCKVSKLTVTVMPYAGTPQAKYLKIGDSYIDPVFDSFKWMFTGVTPSLEDASRDIMKFYPSAEDRLSLEFTNKNGQKYRTAIMSGSQYSGDAKIALSDGSYSLHVSSNGFAENDRFVIGTNEYSYIFQLKQILLDASTPIIKIQNVAAGSSTIRLNLTNNGNYNYTVLNLDGYNYEFRVYANDTTKVYLADSAKITNKILTKSGALIELPADEDYSSSKIIKIKEASGTNLESAIYLNVSMRASTSYDMQIDVPSGNVNGNLALFSVGTSYEKRAVTKYGTYVKYNTESDVTTLYHPGDAANYQIFVAPSSALAKTVIISGTPTTAVDGGAAIETPTKKLYKEDLFTATKEAFTNFDLPNLLAKQKIIDTDGTSIDVMQTIKVIRQASVTFDKTPDYLDDPTLSIRLSGRQYNYSAEVSFSPAVDTTKLRNKKITLFGKDWTFSANTGELNAFTDTGLVLYGGGIQKMMAAGDTATVDVEGTHAVVNIVGVNVDVTPSTAMITVNGESKQMAAGATETLGGVRIYVKQIFTYTVPAKHGAVELFIGTDKLILRDGQAAKKALTDIDGTKVGILTGANSGICR
ncbi:MAG: hypothetical protein Q8O89_04825, partial [Nanoarchaeota archaeon]|nr:hypothetical protein [Nanoarchaeota archaeon]